MRPIFVSALVVCCLVLALCDASPKHHHKNRKWPHSWCNGSWGKWIASCKQKSPHKNDPKPKTPHHQAGHVSSKSTPRPHGLTTPPPSTQQELVGCPHHLQRDNSLKAFGDSCFRFEMKKKKSHHGAEKACKHLGGSLAVVKSQRVEEFIEREISGKWYKKFWIGLNLQEEQEKDVYTFDGGDIDRSKREDSDESDESESESSDESKASKVSKRSHESRPSKASKGSSESRPSKASKGSRESRPSKASKGSSESRPSKASKGSRESRPSKASKGSHKSKASKASKGSRESKASKASKGSRDSKASGKKHGHKNGKKTEESYTYKWVDGTEMAYNNFASIKPSWYKKFDKKCVLIEAKYGKWYPTDCGKAHDHTRQHYICQFPRLPVAPTRRPKPTTGIPHVVTELPDTTTSKPMTTTPPAETTPTAAITTTRKIIHMLHPQIIEPHRKVISVVQFD